MKKIFLVITTFLFGLVLVSCAKVDKKGIIISKYYDALDIVDNAIELYNTGDKDIKLDGLTLAIYQNGDATSTYNIKLTGKIESKGFFVITRETTKNEVLLEKANLKTEDLIYTGNDMIALEEKGKILDAVGFYKSSSDFGKDITLIRKPESYTQKSVYEEFDFIAYQPNLFEYLGNMDFPIKTSKELLEGPKLDPKYLEMPFLDPNDSSKGGGGAVEVTLVRIADGDTATFDIPGHGRETIRYAYINTNEVAGPYTNEEEWGKQASNFNKKYLLANLEGKKIHLQTIKGLNIRDNTSSERLIALVWVDGQLSQHIIVRNGLSAASSDLSALNAAMAYKQIPYVSFLMQADMNAKRLKLGINGEYDSNWDYGNNKLKDGDTDAYPSDTKWREGLE